MPKKGLNEIVSLFDRSGSMYKIWEDAIGGYNTFLREQKEFPGEAQFSLIMFDDQYLVVHDGQNIQDVQELGPNVFAPRGTTALYDAIGKTINSVGKRLNNTPEDQRPEKVIFAIMTDGMENASREFSSDQVFDMITRQQNVYSWEFIYLGANQDAFAVGTSLGINSANIASFDATGVGVTQGYAVYSKSVRSHRTTNES